MKTLIKIIGVLCAVIGVFFISMAFIDRSTRQSDDRLHIAQLKGMLPFGRLSRRREAYDGEEVVAKKIADYRDEEDDDYLDEDDSVVSAVTSRLPRKVRQADPAEQKRISRLRKAAGVAEDEADGEAEDADDDSSAADSSDGAAEEAGGSFSEDELEELLDE